MRFRALGCYPQTGTVESVVTTTLDIVTEILAARTSATKGRPFDRDQPGPIEKKQKTVTSRRPLWEL